MVNVPNKFFTCCSSGKNEQVKEFLESGIPPNARDKYNLTGLMWCGRKGQIEVAKTLIEHGAEIDAVDNTGRTALFHAVSYKRYSFVEFLASTGANTSPVDMHGWSPLDFSRCSRHKKMEAILVKLGATAEKYHNET